MNEPIYFSKIEFRERVERMLNSILLIDLDEGTLAYQAYHQNLRYKAPAITGIEHEEVLGETWNYEMRKPGMRMKNSHTGFEYTMLVDDKREADVVFSYIHRFSKTEKQELLYYCNALDFEPYRDRKISLEGNGYVCSEVDISFVGITSSYIPLIKLPADIYDDNLTWPSVKLHKYTLEKYLSGKKLQKWVNPFRGYSR